MEIKLGRMYRFAHRALPSDDSSIYLVPIKIFERDEDRYSVILTRVADNCEFTYSYDWFMDNFVLEE